MRRRLLHYLLRGLTLLSLLLALATAGVWVRSYWAADYGFWYPQNPQPDDVSTVGRIVLASELGRIHVRLDAIFEEVATSPTLNGFWAISPQVYHVPFRSSCFGYSMEKNDWVGRDEKTRLFYGKWKSWGITAQAPHCAIAVALSILPTIQLIRWQRRRRRVKELGPDARPCPACGYDCRATPGRCSECGSVLTLPDVARASRP